MCSNYIVKEIELTDISSLVVLEGLFDSLYRDPKILYIDEFIINVHFSNEKILLDGISIIKKYRFGIFLKLPMVNIFFSIHKLEYLNLLNNTILDFITPIIELDRALILHFENSIDLLRNTIEFLNKKKWKLIFVVKNNSRDEFEENKNFIKKMKCYFCNTDICILFDFKNNLEIFSIVCKNIDYVIDTINFLGMRNNNIIASLTKLLRQRESGIAQHIDSFHSSDDIELEHLPLKHKTVVRKAMADYALT